MTTLSTHGSATNRNKIIWMLILFMVIEKVLENGVLVPAILKMPFGDLTSNLLYKGIEVLLVLGLNYWLVKQKLYFSFALNFKTIIFMVGGIGYISLFIHSGSVKFLFPTLGLALLTAISEELLYRGVIFVDLLKILTARHASGLNIITAVIVSSLLFSLQHLSNLASQSWLATGCQLIQTFGMGVLFAAVYLRTSSLSLVIFTHFIIDFPMIYLSQISVAASRSAGIETQPSVLGSIIVACLYVICGIIIFHSHLKDRLVKALNKS